MCVSIGWWQLDQLTGGRGANGPELKVDSIDVPISRCDPPAVDVRIIVWPVFWRSIRVCSFCLPVGVMIRNELKLVLAADAFLIGSSKI